MGVFNDARLISAATGTGMGQAAGFLNEWKAQGGSGEDAADALGYYSNPDLLKKLKHEKEGGGEEGGIFKKGKGPSAAEIATSFFQRQLTHESRQGMAEGEFFTPDTFKKLLGNVTSLSGLMDNIKIAAEQIVLQYSQQADLLNKINARTGMLGQLSAGFREEITDAYPDAQKLGISFEELSESITTILEKSGKFRLLNADTIRDMEVASKFTKSLTEYAGLAINFELVSQGADDMARDIVVAGKSAMDVGLNVRKIVAEMAGSLDKLNQYGFKRGIDGLTEMTKIATEFRMNMNTAFTLADKVWSPEGALEVVSNLQVIGGAFGDLNDPIKLMYDATNNVEGLQTAIINASKSLVTFNQEQGRFQVTGVNLRRAKAMADELGISMKDLTDGAVAAAERTRAASDLMATGLEMDDKDREFLTNLAQMKEGKMVIEVPKSLQEQLGLQGTTVALESITKNQADLLLAQKDLLEHKTMEQIARDQVTLVENISRDVSYLVAIGRVRLGETGKLIAEKLDVNFSELGKVSDTIVKDAGRSMNTWFNSITGKYEKGNTEGKIETGAKTVPITNTTMKKEETTATEGPTEIVHKHEGNATITIRSGENLTDALKREIYSDPEFMSQAKESYLHNISQPK